MANPTQHQGQRERFEAWAKRNGYKTTFIDAATCPMGKPVYADHRTHAAWWAYQAAEAGQQEIVDALEIAKQHIDDLTALYAPEFSDEARVAEAAKRVHEVGGRLWSSATVLDAIRAALSAYKARAEANGGVKGGGDASAELQQARTALQKTMAAWGGTCAWHADVKAAIATIDAHVSGVVPSSND